MSPLVAEKVFVETAGATWLAGWTYRVKIQIDCSKIDAVLTHFPLLIHLSAACGQSKLDLTPIFDNLGANYLKLAVTQGDGTTELYVEVEKWDNVGEEAILWVSDAAWSIADTPNTVIYLYFDSLHADNVAQVGLPGSAPAELVWDANYVLVDHMRDDPDNAHTLDSTSNDNDGTKKAADTPVEVNGLIGKAQDFNIDYIDYSNALNPGANDFTIEMFLKMGGTPTNDTFLLWKYVAPNGYFITAYNGWLFCIGKGTVGFESFYPRWSYSAGLWQHLAFAVTRAGADATSYNYQNGSLLGAPETHAVAANITNANVLRLHRTADTNDQIDEFRVSIGIARSAAWIKATYYTCLDNLIFFDAPWFPEYVELGQQDPRAPSPYVLQFEECDVQWMLPIHRIPLISQWGFPLSQPIFRLQTMGYVTHKEVYVIPPFNWVRTITNTVGITDALSKVVGYSRTIANTVGIFDVRTLVGNWKRTITDTVSITSTISKTGAFVRSIANTVGITSVLSKIYAGSRTFANTVGITDTRAVSRNLARTITNTVGITDAVTKVYHGARTITNTVGITDAVTKVYHGVRSIANIVGITSALEVSFYGIAKTFYFQFREKTFKFWKRMGGDG